MQSASFTSKAFGANAIACGIAFVLIPNVLLGLLGISTSDDLWIRLWAMEVVALGFYYVVAGRADLRTFFVASVFGRLTFSALLVVLVLAVSAPWQILILGAFDSLGAVWTLAALRHEGVQQV